MKRIIYASINDGYIGIWWYTPDRKIWAKYCSIDDATQDGDYLQYSTSENHLTIWKELVKENVEDIRESKDLISKGYKYYERGRVIFDLRTQSYLVTCSNKLVNDIDFRRSIITYFNIPKGRVNFEALKENLYS